MWKQVVVSLTCLSVGLRLFLLGLPLLITGFFFVFTARCRQRSWTVPAASSATSLLIIVTHFPPLACGMQRLVVSILSTARELRANSESPKSGRLHALSQFDVAPTINTRQDYHLSITQSHHYQKHQCAPLYGRTSVNIAACLLGRYSFHRTSRIFVTHTRAHGLLRHCICDRRSEPYKKKNKGRIKITFLTAANTPSPSVFLHS